MNFKAEIDVMPLPTLLDPQGKAVSNNMKNIGLEEITSVRIGKHISLFLEANDAEDAEAKVNEACKKLLVNEIMEGYSFTLEQV